MMMTASTGLRASQGGTAGASGGQHIRGRRAGAGGGGMRDGGGGAWVLGWWTCGCMGGWRGAGESGGRRGGGGQTGERQGGEALGWFGVRVHGLVGAECRGRRGGVVDVQERAPWGCWLGAAEGGC